jgi:PLP dependent protein
MNIQENLYKIKSEIPAGITLVAVSKTKLPETIIQAYRAGHKVFGESKAQELVPKHEKLPKDIEWHMIGHLQSNKVKYIAPFISLIHSVDSLKILKAINKEGHKNKRVIPCLLQIHIAEESNKFGLSFEECCQLLESESFQNMQNIEINGVMGMATFTDNNDQISREFRSLKHSFQQLKEKYFKQQEQFKEISMGMSDDYKLGISEGSTMLRIGSAIFGSR